MNALAPVPSPDEATLVLPGGTHPEVAMTQAVERLAAAERRSTAELLQQLRREFPDSPLSVRVRALEALRRR
ncbi:MAG: hypothetical protein WCG92_04735 [Hyphomicrobiales bacterium]|nr:hypothetical protein [Alphaproteobacteria bacterium]